MSDSSRPASMRQQVPDHERVGISQLGPRVRTMIDIVLASPVGTARRAQGERRELRVALAVSLLTFGWGKATDLVTIGVLSKHAQLTYTPGLAGVHTLAATRAISYAPGSRGKLSRVTLPAARATRSGARTSATDSRGRPTARPSGPW